MLEFSHYIYMAAIRRSWSLYRGATLARWLEAHAGTPLEPIYRELKTKFEAEDVSFIDYWNVMAWMKNEHMMCFSSDGSTTSQQLLGHDRHTGFSANDVRMASVANCRVSIYCLSPHPLVPLMLSRFARHVIMQESEWLVSAGMDVPSHVGTAAMHMPMELMAEGIPVVYGQRVDFTFESVETIHGIEDTPESERKPVSVTDIDDLVSRLYDRRTRDFTDLEGTFRGGVSRTSK